MEGPEGQGNDFCLCEKKKKEKKKRVFLHGGTARSSGRKIPLLPPLLPALEAERNSITPVHPSILPSKTAWLRFVRKENRSAS